MCFAFNEFVPASCTNDLEPVDGDIPLGTRAADYPVWGHLPAGIGTFAPASWSGWASRITDAVIPVALVVTALWVASRRGALGVGGALLSITPMAWFMFAVVNPSGLVIAGGFGLWVALTTPVRAGPDRVVGLLAACSWAAMVLPRRDGMVWASLVVAIAILSGNIDVRAHARRLGRAGGAIVVASTLATLAWASRSETNAAAALFLAPLAPVAAWGARRGWVRLGSPSRLVRLLYIAGWTVAALGAGLAIMTRRDDGFDRAVLELVVGRTGGDLTEAIGLLGWLDTPLPTTAVFAWLVGVGVLVGAGIVAARWDALRTAAVILVVGVYASWVLTMLQNDATGTYWQGRYYLPLLVGIPVVLSAIQLPDAVSRRIGMAASVIALVVSNAAMFAMLRRFGVGSAGSLFPWDWDTYEAPLPPVVVLVVHVAASLGLLWWAFDRHDAARADRG